MPSRTVLQGGTCALEPDQMNPEASSPTLSDHRTRPNRTPSLPAVAALLLVVLGAAHLPVRAETLKQKRPGPANRSRSSVAAASTPQVRLVSAQSPAPRDPAYDVEPKPKLSLSDEQLPLPDVESDLVHDSLTLPGAIENYGHGYGCGCGSCPVSPAPRCYRPGDYWFGPGQGGHVRPLSHVWQDRLWFQGDYLLWWAQGSDVPPLVTTSPQGTDQEDAGVLPDATILFGDTDLNKATRSGGRMTLGYWFDPCQRFGLQTSYLALGRVTETFDSTSDGDPILARPFFNIRPTDAVGDPLPGREDSALIAFDGIVEGSVAVNGSSKFQQFELLLRKGLWEQCDHRLEFLFGYQANWLDDDLRIEESLVSTDPDNAVLPPGATIDLVDLFETRNAFHGVSLGLTHREKVGRWSLEMLMKLGLGNTHSEVWIDGSTTTATDPEETPTTEDGGLLALPSNMGEYERNTFSMVPEVGVTLGYDVTCRLRANLGYTFIYWSRVARPGDQIDLDINPSQLSGDPLEGLPRPEFSWVTTDFWAQGLSFGLDYRF